MNLEELRQYAQQLVEQGMKLSEVANVVVERSKSRYDAATVINYVFSTADDPNFSKLRAEAGEDGLRFRIDL